ncbi:MAG: hypothetical protein IJ796_06470 [Lachnospiraceae bacterium]|nr:hypothetical protein [Lachnospiraceae bacterium]
MNLNVRYNNQHINVSLGSISQWCGYNIKTKEFIITSLEKHFSSYKYQEYEDTLINNVSIDGEHIGRKYCRLIRIKDKESLLQSIKNSKIGILSSLIRNKISSFNFQKELEIIDNSLLRIYGLINTEVMEFLGKIELDYDREDILSIVSNSEYVTRDGQVVDALNYDELLVIFLNTLRELQNKDPEKYIIIFENIDHYIEAECYKSIVKKSEEIAGISDTYFIFSTSIRGYALVDEEKCEYITVFNDLVYSMPDYAHLYEFVNSNYPCSKHWGDEVLKEIIAECVHDVGKIGNIGSIDGFVVRKMINSTLSINNVMKNVGNSIELKYLATNI